MQNYLAALTLVLLIAMVLTRAYWLHRGGTKAIHFGELDKTDFLIPPFAIFYSYTVFAAAFDLPLVSAWLMFYSDAVAWLGVVLCVVALVFLLLSLIAFGKSFRVGIDAQRPDKLITTGIFAFSRNPIYVAFVLVLLGEFLVFPNWIPLAYLIVGFVLIHRQILREEEFMAKHYGTQYAQYRQRVRRYL